VGILRENPREISLVHLEEQGV